MFDSPPRDSFFRVATSNDAVLAKDIGEQANLNLQSVVEEDIDYTDFDTPIAPQVDPAGSVTHHSTTESEEVLPVSTRPTRILRQKPLRYRDDEHVDPLYASHSSVSSDSTGLHKIKRVLAQRKTKDSIDYLVQLAGNLHKTPYG